MQDAHRFVTQAIRESNNFDPYDTSECAVLHRCALVLAVLLFRLAMVSVLAVCAA